MMDSRGVYFKENAIKVIKDEYLIISLSSVTPSLGLLTINTLIAPRWCNYTYTMRDFCPGRINTIVKYYTAGK